MSQDHNILASAKPGDVVAVLRPLPEFAVRPDLALALKAMLRTHKLACIDLREIKESSEKKQ
ncbi:MAG TPA: hypothetical protein VH518_21025 [Tepidisphaeraceae bacterium]|jgi:hypothetical protein